MTNSKQWYLSKTLWVNALGVLSAVLLLATKDLSLSPQVLEIIMFIWGIVNIVLRTLTGQPLNK